MTAHDNRLTARDRRSPTDHAARPGHEARDVRGMLGALELLGYDLDGLLASAGLSRADVEDPSGYLAPGACAAVFAQAEREGRVKNLALQLALHTPVGTSPLLDYLIVTSDCVGHGLDRLARYLRLVNPSVHLAIDDAADPVRIVVERSSGTFETELTVSMSILRFMRETGDRLAATYASFTHEPDDTAEYVRVLKCPVESNAGWNGWALSGAGMRLPLKRREPALGRMLEQQAADLLARQPTTTDVQDDVRRVLATLATSSEMRIDVVARRLAMTPRTLQRRLASAGASFDGLRDESRRQAALGYLTDTTLSISEVTYLLGYSEPTAFHRAFRRWHGTTPQAFRERARK